MKSPASLPTASKTFVLLSAFAALCSSASAVTYSFTGSTSSDWATASNWSAAGIAPSGGTFADRLDVAAGAGSLVYSATQGTTTYSSTARSFVIQSGTWNITGGSFISNNTNNSADILGNTATPSSLIVNGGNFTSKLVNFNNANVAVTNTLTIQSGTATITTLTATTANGTSIINLNGGTLAVSTLTASGTSTKTLNLNGGTLKSTASTLNVNGFSNAFVKSGGAIIDTNGFNPTITQALLTDAVSTGGGLTKNGVGTLTLNGTNTYTGATKINVGTLTLGSTGSITPSSAIEIAAGATFNTSAQSFTMLVGQTVTFDLDGSGTGSAALFQAATLNIGSASVNFNVTGSALDDTAYILASYTSVSGTAFGAVSNLPAGYALDYNYLGGNQIALVASTIPEPAAATALLGAAGLFVALARRRRA